MKETYTIYDVRSALVQAIREIGTEPINPLRPEVPRFDSALAYLSSRLIQARREARKLYQTDFPMIRGTNKTTVFNRRQVELILAVLKDKTSGDQPKNPDLVKAYVNQQTIASTGRILFNKLI